MAGKAAAAPLPCRGGVGGGVSIPASSAAAPLPSRGGAGVGSDTLLICTKLFYNGYLIGDLLVKNLCQDSKKHGSQSVKLSFWGVMRQKRKSVQHLL